MKIRKGLPPQPGIYKITNDLNGKVYVGQTVSVRARAGQHKHMLLRNTHFNPPLQASFNKHGADNFTHELVELCAVGDLTTREQFHMNAVPPGLLFNTKPAGPSGTLGNVQPESQKLKHSRAKGGRPFYATHETDGTVLRFEHVGEAIRILPSLQRAHVYSCLHGTRYSHAGYTFDYDPEVQASAPKHIAGRPLGADARSRSVIATDEHGAETVFTYISAIRDAGFSLSAVYDCLAQRKPFYKDRTWRYADGLPHNTAARSAHLKGSRKHGGSKPVTGTHKETGALIHFAYVRLAAETLKIKPQNVSASLRNVAKGVMHSAGGYFWRFDT